MREINKLSKNRPPLNLLEAIQKKEDIRKKGVDEIVVFLMALPTQATLGYAHMNSSIVEKVNGVQVKSLKHLNQLLDLPLPAARTALRWPSSRTPCTCPRKRPPRRTASSR